MEPISVSEYRKQFGSIVQMYQACMHVGKRSALVSYLEAPDKKAIHLLCFIRNAYKERFLPLV